MNLEFGSTVRPDQSKLFLWCNFCYNSKQLLQGYASQKLYHILVIGDKEQGRATYRLLILNLAYNLLLIISLNISFVCTWFIEHNYTVTLNSDPLYTFP